MGYSQSMVIAGILYSLWDTQITEPVGHMRNMARGQGPVDKMTTLMILDNFCLSLAPYVVDLNN